MGLKPGGLISGAEGGGGGGGGRLISLAAVHGILIEEQNPIALV